MAQIVTLSPTFEMQVNGNMATVYTREYVSEAEVLSYAEEKHGAGWKLVGDEGFDSDSCNPRREEKGAHWGNWRWKLVRV
jgi:hypothetical protein